MSQASYLSVQRNIPSVSLAALQASATSLFALEIAGLHLMKHVGIVSRNALGGESPCRARAGGCLVEG